MVTARVLMRVQTPLTSRLGSMTRITNAAMTGTQATKTLNICGSPVIVGDPRIVLVHETNDSVNEWSDTLSCSH